MNASRSMLASALVVGLLAAGALAEPQTRSFTYDAGVLVAIWCDEGGHDHLPNDDPDDHATPVAWLFSGEPECLPSDVRTGDREHAYGGFPTWAGFDDVGATFTVTTDDVGFDDAGAPIAIVLWGTEADRRGEVVEDCGTATAVLPHELPFRHIPPEGPSPTWFWTYVDVVWLDQDSMEPCFGSTGVVSTTLTPAT